MIPTRGLEAASYVRVYLVSGIIGTIQGMRGGSILLYSTFPYDFVLPLVIFEMTPSVVLYDMPRRGLDICGRKLALMGSCSISNKHPFYCNFFWVKVLEIVTMELFGSKRYGLPHASSICTRSGTRRMVSDLLSACRERKML